MQKKLISTEKDIFLATLNPEELLSGSNLLTGNSKKLLEIMKAIKKEVHYFLYKEIDQYVNVIIRNTDFPVKKIYNIYLSQLAEKIGVGKSKINKNYIIREVLSDFSVYHEKYLEYLELTDKQIFFLAKKINFQYDINQDGDFGYLLKQPNIRPKTAAYIMNKLAKSLHCINGTILKQGEAHYISKQPDYIVKPNLIMYENANHFIIHKKDPVYSDYEYLENLARQFNKYDPLFQKNMFKYLDKPLANDIRFFIKNNYKDDGFTENFATPYKIFIARETIERTPLGDIVNCPSSVDLANNGSFIKLEYDDLVEVLSNHKYIRFSLVMLYRDKRLERFCIYITKDKNGDLRWGVEWFYGDRDPHIEPNTCYGKLIVKNKFKQSKRNICAYARDLRKTNGPAIPQGTRE